MYEQDIGISKMEEKSKETGIIIFIILCIEVMVKLPLSTMKCIICP